MTVDAYTQVKHPVSRVAEKILGWLSWIILLAATVISMFFGLVLFSDETSIQNLENDIANNGFFQDILASNNMTATQLVITFQNGVWAFIVYLIICLLISFLALIAMNHRIVSGLLFLVAAIVTIPLFFTVVPLLFFIVAMMMFIRKDRVHMVPIYQQPEAAAYEPQTHTPHEPVHDTATREFDVHYDEPRETSSHINEDTETEPEVLSRSAKYHRKASKEQTTFDETNEHDDDRAAASEFDESFVNEDTSISDDQYETPYVTQDTRYDNDESSKEAVQQRKEEKLKQKEERKQRKKLAKEERKKRPKATVQRRQNFEDRLKVQQDRNKENEKDE